MRQFILSLLVGILIVVMAATSWSIPLGQHNGANPAFDSITFNAYTFATLPSPGWTGAPGAEIICLDCAATNPTAAAVYDANHPTDCRWNGGAWGCVPVGVGGGATGSPIVLDPRNYGYVNDATIFTNLQVTNGSATITLSDNSQGSFSPSFVGRQIEILDRFDDWHAGTSYRYNDVRKPLLSNFNNFDYQVIKPGTSGGAPPVPPPWTASHGYVARDTIKPINTNPGNNVYTVDGAGGKSGLVEPNWGVSCPNINNTCTDGSINYTNRGTSNWPQVTGGRIYDGTVVWEAITIGWRDMKFTGCIFSYVDPLNVTLGTMAGGTCSVPTTYPGITNIAGTVYAYTQSDSLPAYQATLLACREGKAAPYFASCRIDVPGPIALSDSLDLDTVGAEIAGKGAFLNNLAGPTSTKPIPGSPVLWFGPANHDVFIVHTHGLRVHDLWFQGSTYNRPRSFIHAIPLAGHGNNMLNSFYNLADQSGGQAGNFVWGNLVGDNIMIDFSGGQDRWTFDNVRFGNAGRACYANLSLQAAEYNLNNFSCGWTPIAIYMPNGGQTTMTGTTENLEGGVHYWIGNGGQVSVQDQISQPASSSLIPSQYAYFEGAGGRVSAGGVGAILDSALPLTTESMNTDPPLLTPHTYHAHAWIDTDAVGSVIELNFGPGFKIAPSNGVPYQDLTPWKVRLPDVSGGATTRIITFQGVGLTRANLTGTADGIDPTNMLSHRVVRVCAQGSPLNNFQGCSVNYITGPGTYSLRNDQPLSMHVMGNFNVPFTQPPGDLTSGSCTGQGGTAGNPPGDLYYAVTSFVDGRESTQSPETLKVIKDATHGCVLPGSGQTAQFAFQCMHGAQQYGIKRCHTANHDDAACVPMQYDTMDAENIDARGIIRQGSSCLYVDDGSGTETAVFPPTANQTGYGTMDNTLNVGRDPSEIGDVWGLGYPPGDRTFNLLPSYENVVLALSPSIYLRLGEPSGNFLDSSGHSNTCTAAAAVSYGQASLIVDDPNLSAAGGGNGICTAPTSGTMPTHDTFTWVGWIQLTSLSATQELASQKNGGFSILLNGGGINQVVLQGIGLGTIANTAFGITDLNRHFIGVVKDGPVVNFYIDPADGSPAQLVYYGDQTIAPVDGTVYFGSFQGVGGVTSLTGILDETAAWDNVAITNNQMRQLYLTGLRKKFGTIMWDDTNHCDAIYDRNGVWTCMQMATPVPTSTPAPTHTPTPTATFTPTATPT